MITIDDVEYTEDDLSASQKVLVNRVNELNNQFNALKMQLQELDVLMSAYGNALRKDLAGDKEEEESEDA
jgi:peptidoglycan hydrolase CwlO-like protein